MIKIEIEALLPDFEKMEFTDTYDKIGRYLELSIKRNFAEGGRPNTWQPLKKTGQPSHLFKTGKMFNDVTFDSGEDYAEAGMLFHQEVWYWVHQYGSAKRNIPIREYILFQDEDIDFILNEFETDIVNFWDTKGELIN